MDIRARSLTKSFAASGVRGLFARRPAVRGVDFEAAPGQVAALVGENGAGKTTTLRLLAGLLAPDSGEALLGGLPATEPRARWGLGYADEEDPAYAGATISEILRFGARLAGAERREARRAAEEAAERMGIAGEADTPANRCSRGVRRRLALAAALAREPRALILDEPLTALDPPARETVIRALREAARGGAAVLCSLHTAASVEALADRLLVLRRGVLLREGPVSDFLPKGGGKGAGPGPDWLAAAVSGEEPPADTLPSGRGGSGRPEPRGSAAR